MPRVSAGRACCAGGPSGAPARQPEDEGRTHLWGFARGHAERQRVDGLAVMGPARRGPRLPSEAPAGRSGLCGVRSGVRGGGAAESTADGTVPPAPTAARGNGGSAAGGRARQCALRPLSPGIAERDGPLAVVGVGESAVTGRETIIAGASQCPCAHTCSARYPPTLRVRAGSSAASACPLLWRRSGTPRLPARPPAQQPSRREGNGGEQGRAFVRVFHSHSHNGLAQTSGWAPHQQL